MSRRMNFMLTGLTPARRNQIVREVGAQKVQRDAAVNGCGLGVATAGGIDIDSDIDLRKSDRSGYIDRADINDIFSTAFSTVRSRQR